MDYRIYLVELLPGTLLLAGHVSALKGDFHVKLEKQAFQSSTGMDFYNDRPVRAFLFEATEFFPLMTA